MPNPPCTYTLGVLYACGQEFVPSVYFLPVTRNGYPPTWPVSYASSRSAVEQGSCGPDLRAMLLASRLLDEFLVDLTCELCY